MKYLPAPILMIALLALAACQNGEQPANSQHAVSQPENKTIVSGTPMQPAMNKTLANKAAVAKSEAVVPETVPSQTAETPVAAEHRNVSREKARADSAMQKSKAMQSTAMAMKSAIAKQAVEKKAKEKQTLTKPKAATPVTVTRLPAGDVAKGKLLARKCAVCHNFNAKKKVGPGLAGIFGREAGTAPGFKYKFTKYIKPGKAWHWDAAHLAAWDCDAKAAVKVFTGDPAAKTKMAVQHVCDAAKQADLIAFFKTL